MNSVNHHLPAEESSNATASQTVNAERAKTFIFPVVKQTNFIVSVDTSLYPPNTLSIGSVVQMRSVLQDTRTGVVYKLSDDSNIAEIVLAGDVPVRCIEAKLYDWWVPKASLAACYL